MKHRVSRAALAVFTASSLCISCAAPTDEGQRLNRSDARSAPEDRRADVPPPPKVIVPDSEEGRTLVKAIAAAERDFGVAGRPCLMRNRVLPGRTPAQFTRTREIQSDSHWLNRHIRETYPERWLYSALQYENGRYRHVIALTGDERVPALDCATAPPMSRLTSATARRGAWPR